MTVTAPHEAGTETTPSARAVHGRVPPSSPVGRATGR